MDPTPWMRRASSGVTFAHARRTTALGRPAASLRCGAKRVCRSHGGASPQAKAKASAMIELAELRLRGLAPRAVAELEALVTSASSEAVRLGVARDLGDRSVGKAREEFKSLRPSWSKGRGDGR